MWSSSDLRLPFSAGWPRQRSRSSWIAILQPSIIIMLLLLHVLLPPIIIV
jgi:hypothetical protein